LSEEQRRFAQPACEHMELAGVIANIGATILIGLSTACGAFTEPIIREMARKVERPIILPLSNPTEKCEAAPEDLLRWTGGRALVAAGSPFAPVNCGGRSIPISQCNNVYIFPAVGLGVCASGARRVTDGMMLAAAHALAACDNPAGRLLPPLTDLRHVTHQIAVAVGMEAQRAGLAPQTTEEELRHNVNTRQWTPAYAN